MRLMAAVAVECCLQGLGSDLGVAAGKTLKLQAAAEELRSAALVGNDVRVLMAEHDTPRRRHVRQRQRVCRGSGRHQKYRNLALENLRHAAFDGAGPFIIAVAARIAAVSFGYGIENGRRDGRGIVTGKVHRANRISAEGRKSVHVRRIMVMAQRRTIALPYNPWST